MKVFKINDTDWWMAPTLEEAKAAALALHAGEPLEELEREIIEKEARELTEEELDRLIFSDEEEDGDAPRRRVVIVKRTFREELQRRIADGRGTEMFTSTEF